MIMIMISIWLIKNKCYIFWKIIIKITFYWNLLFNDTTQVFSHLSSWPPGENILGVSLLCPVERVRVRREGKGRSPAGHLSITEVTGRQVLRGCTSKPKIRKLVLSKYWCPHSSWQVLDTLGMCAGLQQANVDYTGACLAFASHAFLMQTSDA